jgi:four helix bundle protein
MMSSRNYTDLIAWQKAMDLVVMVYRETTVFPKEERYGLTNQLRRAAVSIPSNIAEGQGRQTTRDFQRFLTMAYGSLREVETQVSIAERLEYIERAKSAGIHAQCAEVGRLVNGLSNSLVRRSNEFPP